MVAVVEMLHSGYKDMDWFNLNLSKLRKEFNNSFVAISSEKVIDSDKDLDALIKRLKNKNINTSNVFIEFISDVKSIL